MPVTVQIPTLDNESRIGKAFNDLFLVISRTESVNISEEVIWDFSKCHFLHPFFIGGLCIYRHHTERRISLKGMDSYPGKYLSLIHFDTTMELPDVGTAEALMDNYRHRSYIPICKFGASDDEIIDSVTSALQKIIQAQASLPAKCVSALSYLIGELTTNIHDHSQSEYGFMFSQYLERENCINLCIADTGVSIYGSFYRSHKFDVSALQDEGHVLNMALSQFSTKNLPEQENRGFGLPTTKRMLVEGMRGSFFILSGNAFHRHDSQGEYTAVLPDCFGWDGTIVLLKIPVSVPEGFNYLNYVDKL